MLSPAAILRRGARKHLLASVLALLLATTATTAWASTATDLHWLQDDRCAECHGHSGDFTRRFLGVEAGRLVGRHHVDDLRAFMRHHYLTPGSVDAVYDMLLAQVLTAPRFRQECSQCHGSASSLVRNGIILREGQSPLLRWGQNRREFLQGHRDLQPGDVDFFVSLLTRIAAETGQR